MIPEELDEDLHVLFGDAVTNEMGMKQKVDEMYDMLIQSKGLIRIFGGIKGILGFLIVLGASVAVVKGWLKW